MKHIFPLFLASFFAFFSALAQQDSTFQTRGFFVTHDPYMIDVAIQQADGKILVSGSFSHYEAKPVSNIIRLLQNGERDSTFDSTIGTNGTISQMLMQADGKIIVSGVFTRYKQQPISTGLIRILQDGTLDNTFNPHKPVFGYNGVVTVSLQSDGKIILAGFGLIPATTYNDFGIIRLNNNGTFDNTFNTQYILKQGEVVNSISQQQDGKILLGGSFTDWKNVACTGLKRLNSDGSPDTSFHLSGQGLRPAINGNITTVQCIRMQGDSAILIGGNFGYYDNLIRTGVARLHLDGSIDAGFSPTGSLIPYGIESVEPTADNKIVVGGHFYMGSQAKNLILFDADGSISTNASIPGPDNSQAFTPGIKKIFINTDGSFIAIGGFTGYYDGVYHGNIAKFSPDLHFDADYKTGFQKKGLVNRTAIQSDGKIVVVGEFNQYGLDGNGEQNRIARLLANGQLDTSFHSTGASHYVNNVAIQTDGKVLIAGSFSSVNNSPKKGIARFHADGTLDQSFNTGTGPNDANMYSMITQGNQYIYISGSFSSYDNTLHQGIVRLLWNGDVDQTFDTRGTPVVAPYSIETTIDDKVLAAEGSDKVTRDYNAPLRLYRLNKEGSIDNSFQTPRLGWSMGYKVKRGKENTIYWMGELIQAATPNRFEKTIIRLKENGQLDSSAKRLPGNYVISDFTILPDSNLVICGQRVEENEDSVFFVLKLNADLSIDSTFNPVALYYNLKHINYTTDNRIVVAGEPIRYFRFTDEQVQNIALLTNSSIHLRDAVTNNRVTNILDTLIVNEAIVGNSTSNSFTINNTSQQNITLLDPSKVVLSGANAGEFSIVMEHDNTIINKQDSLRFTLKFSPSSAGHKKIRITIPYSNGIDNKYSFVVTGKANLTTPVTDIGEGAGGVQLYPNPTSNGVVYVKTKKKFQHYSIIDISGHVIQQGVVSPSISEVFALPVKTISGGIYWLKLKSKNEEVSIKMIVQ